MTDTTDDLHRFEQRAISVVREVGDVARRSYRGPKEVTQKKNRENVTDMDLEVERDVIDFLSGAFPDHGFISEEKGEINADAEYVWVLDPIDGTNYYIREIPLYSISLGLRHRQELILGFVYNPTTEELFSARSGAGARLNGQPVTCSQTTSLETAMLCVDIPSQHSPKDALDYALEKVGILVQHLERVRVFGVSALGLCYCATGGFDAYVNFNPASKIWDLAAGQVILEEAGGVYTQCGNDVIVAGPQALHDQLLELLDLAV